MFWVSMVLVMKSCRMRFYKNDKISSYGKTPFTGNTYKSELYFIDILETLFLFCKTLNGNAAYRDLFLPSSYVQYAEDRYQQTPGKITDDIQFATNLPVLAINDNKAALQSSSCGCFCGFNCLLIHF